MAEAVVCCKRTSFYACERTGRLHVIQGVQASDNVALLETHNLPFFFCFMYHKNETKSWLIFQVSSQRIVLLWVYLSCLFTKQPLMRIPVPQTLWIMYTYHCTTPLPVPVKNRKMQAHMKPTSILKLGPNLRFSLLSKGPAYWSRTVRCPSKEIY